MQRNVRGLLLFTSCDSQIGCRRPLGDSSLDFGHQHACWMAFFSSWEGVRRLVSNPADLFFDDERFRFSVLLRSAVFSSVVRWRSLKNGISNVAECLIARSRCVDFYPGDFVDVVRLLPAREIHVRI